MSIVVAVAVVVVDVAADDEGDEAVVVVVVVVDCELDLPVDGRFETSRSSSLDRPDSPLLEEQQK